MTVSSQTAATDGEVFRDLRSYIDFLEENNQLEEVRGADWDLELGGLTRLMIRNRPSPALLFDDVKDHEPGFRVLTNALTSSFQWSAAIGATPTWSKRELILAQKEQSISDTHPPRTVDDGPVLENVDRGDEVDVTKFPAPKWNENDGGRYIGTADAIITRNYETGRHNVGTYRVQMHGPKEVTVYISPGKDGMNNQQSYWEHDEPAPIAVSLGHAPDIFIGSNERMPSNVPELDYIGGRRGEPVDVIEGETTGLPIPAHSEIVLEGHIHPDAEGLPEGPFGEWTGYYAGGSYTDERHTVKPLEIERVYYRDNPILLGVQLLPPPAQVKSEVRNAARLWNELDEAGIPGIEDVNVFPGGPNGWFTAISINQQYGGHAAQTGYHAASGQAGGYHGRFTVIVDDDVDAFDQDEVIWAICSRCDPAEDIHILEDCWSTSLDPRIDPDRKRRGDFTNTRAVVDATRPYHWRDEFPKVNTMSQERSEAIREKYADLINQSVR